MLISLFKSYFAVPVHLITTVMTEPWSTVIEQKLPRGCIVRCLLANGLAYHTGIYVGNEQIIELNGNGRVTRVSFSEFKNVAVGDPRYITVLCNKAGIPYYSPRWADMAESVLKTKWDYNMFSNNCHRFVLYCLFNRNPPQHSFYSCGDIERAVSKDDCKWCCSYCQH